MKIFYAKYILPVTSEVIEDGAVVIEGRKIVDFGKREEIEFKFKDIATRKIDLKNALIMPGFVNAHTHLELSDFKMERPKDFKEWLWEIVLRKDEKYAPKWYDEFNFIISFLERRWLRKIYKALQEIIISGTIAIGDVTNTGELVMRLVGLPLKVHIFVELIAFSDDKALQVFEKLKSNLNDITAIIEKHNYQNKFRLSFSAHAPYSVSERLFKLIKSYNDVRKTSVHLAEPIEEIEFIKHGTGFFKDFLTKRGSFNSEWQPPGKSPVKYLDDIGFLDENTLAVHCVNVDEEDIQILSSRNVSVCTCPRSNFFLKVGKAPVRKFLDNGINVCLGTDSKASNDDLNILNELRFAREYYRDVSDEELIKIATINGAKALGFDTTGSIERGKDADLIYFTIPKDLKKSEIYEFIFSSSLCGRLA